MKIINNGLVKDKYDVIVVGAGIGGITAGALLAKKGFDVLVIEQHYLPGGVCSTIKRKGISMDAGAAMLFGWGETLTPHRFVMNELEENVYMIPHKCYYRMHFGEKSVTFWKDFKRFFKELNTAFPGNKVQFEGFYSHTKKIYDDLMADPMPMSPDTLPLKMALKMFFKHPIRTLRLQKYMNASLKDVLDLYIKDPQIESLFDLLIATCYCTKIEETPLMLAAPIVWEAFGGGVVYPAGSPQMFPNTLEKAMEKYGGQILYRHLVQEILIKNGAAYGILLEDGTEILAEKVISDATIWNLYGNLIKPEHISSERLEWAHSFEPTLSCVLLYMGLNAKVIPKGTNAIEVFIGDLNDMTKDTLFCYIPSIDDPSICPEGTHSMTVLCSTSEVKWPKPNDYDYQSDEYYRKKEEFANNILYKLEAKFPGFRDNILTLDIATPATIERFTMKNFGNIGGPKQALGQHLMNRLQARSEFKNLFCVGDSTVMGEGVISTTASAVGAANMILKDLNMRQYLPRKFSKDYVNYVQGKPRILLPSLDEDLNYDTAKRLANECQWCEDPKCIKKCPAAIDIPNFLRRLESENYSGAAREIRQMNPLAEICGYICPSKKFCESECYHLDFSDDPVYIKRLQTWVSETAGLDGFNKVLPKLNGKRIAIVGSGPAGISCAHFLARLGYLVDIYEKMDKPGGMLTYGIPAFRLPRNAIERELNGVLLPNIKIIYRKELGKDIQIEQLSNDYNSVFLALGLWKGNKLSIPGIEEKDLTDALSFIFQYNANNKMQVRENVIIVGGGSVATDAANIALKLGAKNVRLVCLESEGDMPALQCEINELKKLGVKIHNSWGPIEVSNNALICAYCTNLLNKQGNFNPSFDETQKMTLNFDQIIMAVGQSIEDSLGVYLKKKFGIEQITIDTETQLIKNQTKIYAGGDLVRGAGTVVEAIADGRRVAMEIDKKLKENN